MGFSTKNTGLPSNFRLVNGKFETIGGKPKVDDNLRMLIGFSSHFRVFTPGYIIGIYRFYQNTTNFIFSYKNVFRLRILEAARKYIPYGDFRSVDIPIDYSKRKEIAVLINYRYRLEKEDAFSTIKVLVE
jgi:hypothetical protein